ncbi:MAG: glycosyltransferase family 2 protein [Acidobacteria bacterium]|nr:glycosyltransferase family 2 protein [Acidobacteriota bacterium]
MKSTTLYLLSYNEREALEKLMPLIPLSLFDRVVAIDPGSSDGTLELYKDAGIPCVIQPNKGRGNAFLHAQSLCDTERLVFFSTDGNEDPNDLPKILAFLDQDYDMVIAGRFVLPGSCSDNSDDRFLIRRYGSMTYSAIARLVWRTGVYDACNGFRGYKLESMKRMRLDAPLHEIEIQSTIRAAKLGMRVKEFPTHELRRLGGAHKRTAATFTLAWRTGASVLRELVVNP